MPPDVQERIKALEDWRSGLDVQQLNNPLDFNSERVVKKALDKTFIELLRPLETAAAAEGTHTLLNNTPCIQLADAATEEGYFALVPHENILLSSMEFIWSTPATSGDLRWQIDLDEGGDSDTTNLRSTGGTAVSTVADGTANELSFTDILFAGAGVSLDVLKRGNLWGIKFSRLGGASEDSLTNTVNLYGILIKYKLYAF